jgi:oligosaccharide repeat unit polymerase
MKIAGISIFKISIPGILISFIYLFQYLGIPIILYFPTKNLIDLNLDNSILILVFFYTSLTITLLISGFIFGRICFGRIKQFKIETLNALNAQQLKIVNFIIIFCSIVLFIYINEVGFQSLALLNAIGIYSDMNIGMARSIMTNSFEGSYHWYKLIITDLFSFAFLILFSNFIISKKVSKIYLIILFCFVIFSLMLSTEKGPVMMFLISVYFAYSLIKNEGLLHIKYLINLIVFFFLVLIFIYTYILNFQNLDSSITSIFERIFTGQIIPAYHYLDFFPLKEGFLLGRSFPNPSGILPFTPYPLTQTISAYYTDMPVEVTGSSPTIFWGELYANFGLYGILIFSPLVGFFIYGFNIFLVKIKPNSSLIAFYSWSILHFSYLSGTSLSTYLFDIYLIVITFSFIIISSPFKIKFYK